MLVYILSNMIYTKNTNLKRIWIPLFSIYENFLYFPMRNYNCNALIIIINKLDIVNATSQPYYGN